MKHIAESLDKEIFCIGGFTMNQLSKDRVYHAAVYVRLSKEDGDKEERDSIVNQKELIRAFLADKTEIRI